MKRSRPARINLSMLRSLALPALLYGALLDGCHLPVRDVHITPHVESMRATVGRAPQICPLFIYPHRESAGACRISVDHCTGLGPQMVCGSPVDERTIPCGEKREVCGQGVICDCPAGAPPHVPEPPGSLHVTPLPDGRKHADPAGAKRCQAAIVDPPGGQPGPNDARRPLCSLKLDECDEGPCRERFVMISCGERVKECGRTFLCDCPNR
jgi:hypothetical protein